VKGITIAGIGIGGEHVTGIAAAIGTLRIPDNGSFTGFGISAFNYIKGKQTGVTIGIFNYAHQLTGVQIGVLNYVRDNPDYLKALPLININF